MAKMQLKIVTPERIVFEGTVDSLTAMTENGEITILPNHVPLATLLKAGEMRAKVDGEDLYLAASTGMLEVKPGNEIVVLADSAERFEELELAEIEAAKTRAEEAVSEARRKNDVTFADAAAHLERELARYKVALKGRKTHRTAIEKTGKGLKQD